VFSQVLELQKYYLKLEMLFEKHIGYLPGKRRRSLDVPQGRNASGVTEEHVGVGIEVLTHVLGIGVTSVNPQGKIGIVFSNAFYHVSQRFSVTLER